jgi:hypothetical protein
LCCSIFSFPCNGLSFFLAIVLSVILWITASDYPFGIFKLNSTDGFSVIAQALIWSFQFSTWNWLWSKNKQIFKWKQFYFLLIPKCE